MQRLDTITEGVVIFPCYIRIYCKFSSLKHHTPITAQFIWVPRSLNTALWGPPCRVSQRYIAKVSIELRFSSRPWCPLQAHSGRIQFLEVVRLRLSLYCWLLAGWGWGPSQLLKLTLRSKSMRLFKMVASKPAGAVVLCNIIASWYDCPSPWIKIFSIIYSII